MKALRKPLSLFMALLMCLGVFASTLFIKQHVIADVFGGIVVFEAGFRLAGRIQKAIRQ